MDISQLAKSYEDYIIKLRRWFHENPELSFKEKDTAAKIKEELEGMGIPYVHVPPYENLVAEIKGGAEGKTIALRADMDALAVCEETTVEYKSKREGVMHACGHDAHVAMLLGAAAVLNKIKHSLKGRILLCFQSAEECGSGAQETIDYLDSIGGVDQAIGLHIWGSIPSGTLAVMHGACMAGSVRYKIDVQGRGGHGSRPDLALDPIKPLCDMVLKIASIPSNFYDVLDHSVVNTGMIQSGTTHNVIPDKASAVGVIRHFKPEGEKKVFEIIEQMAKGVEQIYGVSITATKLGSVLPIINSSQCSKMAADIANKIEGLSADETVPPICASDNFGSYLHRYGGFYGILGGMNESKGIVYPQHSTMFDVDENALRMGCEFLAQYAAEFLG